ncbi:MAG TPA: OB-fold domain-containing protein [Xanthobacteraceae bacterium]|jgi:hypothetical protein|nr:OB-fold domain-containing protein [Xanthobacteraceae bacterium]
MSNKSNVIVSNEPWKKPLPNIDKDNAPFYEGLKRHEFLLWRCKTCGASYWPKAYCQSHENEPFAANMEWAPSSGRGKIFAFNRHHMAFHPAFQAETPYVYALIELDEGPLVSSTLVGHRLPGDVYDIGQTVEVVYEDHPAEGFSLPRFRIVE